MATGSLNNNSGTFIFANDQENNITLHTEDKFVDSNIILNTINTKAVLNASGNDYHKSFDIQVPNGTDSITFHFEVDTNGNVTVT